MTSHARTKWKISPQQAIDRQARWQILRDNNAHLLWHPSHVDRALDAQIPAQPFSGLISVASEPDERSSSKAVPDQLMSDSREVNTLIPMRDFVAASVASRIYALGCGQDGAVLADEIVDRATEIVEKHSHRFVPCRHEMHMGYVSQGYEAFLRQHFRGLLRSICRLAALRRNTIPLIPEVFDQLLPSMSPPLCAVETREMLLDALRSVLGENPQRWQLVYDLSFASSSLREHAMRLGRSKSWVSESIARPLLQVLRSQLGEIAPDNVCGHGTIADVCSALAAMVSEEEFRKSVPKPSASRKGRNIPGHAAFGDQLMI